MPGVCPHLVDRHYKSAKRRHSFEDISQSPGNVVRDNAPDIARGECARVRACMRASERPVTQTRTPTVDGARETRLYRCNPKNREVDKIANISQISVRRRYWARRNEREIYV